LTEKKMQLQFNSWWIITRPSEWGDDIRNNQLLRFSSQVTRWVLTHPVVHETMKPTNHPEGSQNLRPPTDGHSRPQATPSPSWKGSPTWMLVASEKPSSVRIKGFPMVSIGFGQWIGPAKSGSTCFRPQPVAPDHQGGPAGPAGLGIGRLLTSLQQCQLKICRFNRHDILLCHPCHQCIPSLSIICYIKKKKQVSLYQKYQGTASERCQSNPHGHAQQRTGDQNRRVLCKLFSLLFSKLKGSIPTWASQHSNMILNDWYLRFLQHVSRDIRTLVGFLVLLGWLRSNHFQ
jgi:hypothetical protein